MKYTVIEGATGVLELIDSAGNRELYHPDCDLDKAQQLLYEFYDLKTAEGRRIKDSFERDGINWFPSVISALYWQYFYQIIKYRKLIDKYLLGDVYFRDISEGKFHDLVDLLSPTEKNFKSRCISFIKYFAAPILYVRNFLLCKKSGDLMFFHYGVGDFRTKQILDNLKSQFSVLEITLVGFKSLARYFFNRDIFVIPRAEFPSVNSVHLESSDQIFRTAVSYVERLIAESEFHHKICSRIFRTFQYRLFFGIDDANFVYPFIYAAQDNGMRALGFQHGVYARRHEAYVMARIDGYRWYDNVLVWGGYWRDALMKNSDHFNSEFFIICCNKHEYDYSSLPKTIREKSIMIPYEFLADTICVGGYIREFVRSGFKVYFKCRSDEPVNVQLEAYFITDLLDQITVVADINPEVMADIDIVAGTQTTLLFDLLPYKKPTLVLDTPFRLLQDMVDDGLAILVTENDIDRIDGLLSSCFDQAINRDYSYFFESRNLNETISGYLALHESK